MTVAVGRRTDQTPGRSPLRFRLVVAASLAYVSATAIGVLMRLVFVGFDAGLPFDHLLHAHSHTLYFGWAAIGILVGAIDLLPGCSRALSRAAWALSLTFPVVLGGFLAVGYSPATIAISSVVMGAWYVMVSLWWRATRGMKNGTVFLFRSAFGYLLAASVGVWVLGFLQVTEIGTPLSEALAVHAFLFGFAWFLVFGVVGMIMDGAAGKGLILDTDSISRASRWWTPLAFLTFPLGVPGGPEVIGLGPLARVSGVLLLYPGWLWARTLWKGARPSRWKWTWRLVAVWFAIAAWGIAVVAVLGSEALTDGGRQGVVIYLHVLLVGFVTTSLFALLPSRPVSARLLGSHGAALGLMLAGLAIAAVGPARVGFWLAAGGGTALWLAGVAWSIASMRGGV